MTGRSLRLGSLTLDVDRLCFEGDSGPAALRPKTFDVLRYLLEHPGRVVTKEELIGAVWPSVMVTDDSLAQCISEARRAIGDGDKRLIKTIPRRGYMVEAPPTKRTDESGAASQLAPTEAATESPCQGHKQQRAAAGAIAA